MSNTCACCLRGLVFLAVVDYVASELPSPPLCKSCLSGAIGQSPNLPRRRCEPHRSPRDATTPMRGTFRGKGQWVVTRRSRIVLKDASERKHESGVARKGAQTTRATFRFRRRTT